MPILSTDSMKDNYKCPISSILTVMYCSKLSINYYKTGDTYPMVHFLFMFSTYWTNEKWYMPTFPQICQQGYNILK